MSVVDRQNRNEAEDCRGGNAGIGYEIVKSLSKLPNHQVLMGCRDTHKGELAVASMGAPLNVNPMQLDITDDESIEHAYLTIAQMFGKLDVLIHNAGKVGIRDALEHRGSHVPGTGGQDLPDGATERQKGAHVYNVNVTSAVLLTTRLAPLLEKSKLPKLIFVSSDRGSIQRLLAQQDKHPPLFFYGSSKAAVNHLMALYTQRCPKWKVNAVCPGARATGLNKMDENEDTDPALGAVRVQQLVEEGLDGVTGTYSNSEGPLPF